MSKPEILLACAALAATCGVAQAGEPIAPSRITFVHMGGNDCPPCKEWRATELPKLQASPEFQAIRYVYVTKSIPSSVPPAFAFPRGAEDLQPALARASSGFTGSPHEAILVDGKVVDYWFGTHKGSAEQILAIVHALRSGDAYPRPRCVALGPRRSCVKPAAGDTY